ncbi:MAG TPA: GNAT family N-acetyltransferase [Roseiarcus sp.]|nr:GNAT family N-acetyltransferase [Roseiarcus sp.]
MMSGRLSSRVQAPLWDGSRSAVREGVGELGYRLCRDAWGRGLASEGASALVAIGFADKGFVRIVATTMAVNRASRRVMEKTGLTHVRTVYPHWRDPLLGSELGEVEYEITRDEWEAKTSGRLSAPIAGLGPSDLDD